MGRRFAVIVCALTSAFQRPQAPRAPRHIARPTRVASLPPTPEDAEDEVSWRRSVTSADFDDALVYRLFRRQFEILLPGFVPKKQLAVSARRGKASLRRLRLNATALNRLFNPLAVDEGFPLQLLRCVCDSVSIAWTSVFTLNRDPLEVRINKIEFEFDQEARRPTKYQLGEAKREWDALAPAPAAFMNEYPTIEGARFLVDELVCVARRVEAPFPRGGNSTVRLTLRGVDARSVDNASAVVDLRRCWASYNPAPNAAAAFIAKRVVAREALVEIKFDDHEAAPDAPEAAASAAATAASAASAALRSMTRRKAAEASLPLHAFSFRPPSERPSAARSERSAAITGSTLRTPSSRATDAARFAACSASMPWRIAATCCAVIAPSPNATPSAALTAPATDAAAQHGLGCVAQPANTARDTCSPKYCPEMAPSGSRKAAVGCGRELS